MKRHLIGIGGVGMSALAVALLKKGDEVTALGPTGKEVTMTILKIEH